MSSKIESLEVVWEEIKAGLDSIFKLEPTSLPRYMQLYTNVYNSCTPVVSKKSVNDKGVCDQKCSSKFMGLEMYKKFREYLRSHVHNIRVKGDTLSDEQFLIYFEESWSKYRISSKVLAGICGYLNRYWVKREREEGKKNVFHIFVLAVDLWREVLLNPKSGVLMNGILDQIDRERSGEVISTMRLEKIIQCLVELGISKEQQMNYTVNSGVPPESHMQCLMNSGTSGGSLQLTTGVSQMDTQDPVWKPSLDDHSVNLSVYQEYFEEPFLNRTGSYYRMESATFLQSHTIPEYLKKVEVRLNEEEARVKTYLHVSTRPKLIRSCENYLICEHLDILTSAFQSLLIRDDQDDIRRMYKLVKNFDEGLRCLVSMVESHVVTEGHERMRQIASSAITDAKLYIDTILGIHRKNHNLVISAFGSDPAFARALDKGCESFINTNAVTELAGSPTKSAELLAKYVDFLLRKSQKETLVDDFDEALNQVATVFKYIEDKYVFQKFYSKSLARRLVNSQSISEDYEASMISRLKETCGFEYTSKLQRMFHDVSATRELNAKFQAHIQKHDSCNLLRGVDCNVMILSSNAWPFQPQAPFSVPPELEHCHTTFLSFYNERHSGRKLNWCYHLSRGEMITCYTRTRHTLQVSAYQIAVLMLYNNALMHTVASLQAQTSIDLAILLQVLQILLKVKILKTSSLPSDPPTQDSTSEESSGTQLTPETALTLNVEYKNKRIRVNLNAPLKNEAKQETEQTLRNVEVDRKAVIEACIVRIMKTRRTLTHKDLITEVISQIRKQFNPTIPLIKRSITALIDREYIKRDNENHDTYEYMA